MNRLIVSILLLSAFALGVSGCSNSTKQSSAQSDEYWQHKAQDLEQELTDYKMEITQLKDETARLRVENERQTRNIETLEDDLERNRQQYEARLNSEAESHARALARTTEQLDDMTQKHDSLVEFSNQTIEIHKAMSDKFVALKKSPFYRPLSIAIPKGKRQSDTFLLPVDASYTFTNNENANLTICTMPNKAIVAQVAKGKSVTVNVTAGDYCAILTASDGTGDDSIQIEIDTLVTDGEQLPPKPTSLLQR